QPKHHQTRHLKRPCSHTRNHRHIQTRNRQRLFHHRQRLFHHRQRIHIRRSIIQPRPNPLLRLRHPPPPNQRRPHPIRLPPPRRTLHESRTPQHRSPRQAQHGWLVRRRLRHRPRPHL